MDKFRETLKDSGLTDAVAKKLKLLPQPADKAPAGIPYKGAGFVIPYFDLDGKPTKFWRWRYLEEVKASGFSGLIKRKPLRYVQPKNSVSEIYLPPLRDWRKVAADSLAPIIITEGEKKAAAGTSLSPYPTIGLGGVWSWKSANNKMPMLPGFAWFKWEQRPVYIIFDSDAVTNPKVIQAENSLARALADLGALPHIVRLPMRDDGRKMGLDDYLLWEGVDKLEQLMEHADTWEAARELHQLNEEVVYVRDPGLIIRLDNLQRMAPRAFKEHAYSTRVYWEQQDTPNGTKLVQKSAPNEWLKWPARAEVAKTTYKPGDERVTEAAELNMWPGWAVEPVKGDITPWKQLLDNLFGDLKEERKWFERWCAYPFQHPGQKMFSCAVLWGLKHGTGKSLIGYTLGRIYGSNFQEVSDEHIHSGNNDWAENKQFVMGDEITGGDKRGQSDRLKGMITREAMRINVKYVPTYSVPDVLNYYFTSNHPDAFFLEDKDRRYFIHEVTNDPLPLPFYKAYEAWFRSAEGAGALFHHLLSLDLEGFEPKGPAMMTHSKTEMLNSGRSDLGLWVATLRESPDTILRFDNKVLPFKLWRSEDLLRIYDPQERGRVTANGLSRELTRQGFKKAARGHGVFTQSDGQVRLWVLRDVPGIDKMLNREIGEYYDQERTLNVETKRSKWK